MFPSVTKEFYNSAIYKRISDSVDSFSSWLDQLTTSSRSSTTWMKKRENTATKLTEQLKKHQKTSFKQESQEMENSLYSGITGFLTFYVTKETERLISPLNERQN